MWRYYAQRATTGEWLDTNAQLSNVDLGWALSAPSSGSALIPVGTVIPEAEDGRPVWGKQDTLCYAEDENEELRWVGICTGAVPNDKGLNLSFIGPRGWLERVDFNGVIRRWETDVFHIVRTLINHAETKPQSLSFHVTQGGSAYSVGDEQPPAKPRQPARRKGEKKSDYTASKRYKDWQEEMTRWTNRYGDREPYTLAWWEAPSVGEEIDSLAKETGFDYRERFRWVDRAKLQAAFHLDLADNMVKRRDDIAFVDGVNLAAGLDPDHSDDYANRVIALGAGEGRKMRMERAGGSDGRLYQSEYVLYKTIRNTKRLKALAQADRARLADTAPNIKTIVAWDVEGFAPLNTLQVGDEVKVQSTYTDPETDLWRRVVGINRNPESSLVTVTLEES